MTTLPPLDTESRGELVGASAVFMTTLAHIRRIAASEAPLLIEGETGTGKELAARAVHYWGVRSSGPFVPVNCGALPDHLLEAELFGHERGAFTDAKLARRGLVAEANGGTLFLDEVDALSAKAQIALLRFVQDQRYRPLGSSRELSCNVRLIAATNQPLADVVQQGRFRGDLMYRLKILQLVLPPLRERTGDALRLAQHFVGLLCLKYRLPLKGFDVTTIEWMSRHPWPGNVRELENWVHRELLMADGLTIGAMLSSGSGTADPTTSAGWAASAASAASVASAAAAAAAAASAPHLGTFHDAKAEAMGQFERDYVCAALRQAGGNVTRAAQIAGKERRAFGKLIKKHGIARATPRG